MHHRVIKNSAAARDSHDFNWPLSVPFRLASFNLLLQLTWQLRCERHRCRSAQSSPPPPSALPPAPGWALSRTPSRFRWVYRSNASAADPAISASTPWTAWPANERRLRWNPIGVWWNMKLTRHRKIDKGLPTSEAIEESSLMSLMPFTLISLFFNNHWIRIVIKSAFSYSEKSRNQVTM